MIILTALAAGLGLGMLGGATIGPNGLLLSDAIGRLWLDALKMTIVPLVVALLVTGIVKAAKAARAGPIALRTIISFLAILWLSSLMAALLVPALLQLWPLSSDAAMALIPAPSTQAEVPGLADFLNGLVPTNIVEAAANNAILPLTLFTLLFAFAMMKIEQDKRDLLAGFFEALADTMLVIIGWVLRLAPIGVFALAVGMGARAGLSALGVLVHYVVIVSAAGLVVLVAAYGLARFGGGIGLKRFATAMLPAQAVAISTQSSLASLPAMVSSCSALGVSAARADLVLPLAVALFRATGPAMNLAVALYVAHWAGIEPGWFQLMAGVAVAATTTLAAVSLPGQLSFVSSIAPIAMVMGVPVEPLVLLIAVETVPDIMRTLGNVTMDVAITATIDARNRDAEAA